MEFIQQFINGLNLGSIYALMALGYTMVYGIAKMLNFAHGDIIMVGAYTISVGATMFGLSPIASVLLSMISITFDSSYYSDRCELFLTEYSTFNFWF